MENNNPESVSFRAIKKIWDHVVRSIKWSILDWKIAWFWVDDYLIKVGPLIHTVRGLVLEEVLDLIVSKYVPTNHT